MRNKDGWNGENRFFETDWWLSLSSWVKRIEIKVLFDFAYYILSFPAQFVEFVADAQTNRLYNYIYVRKCRIGGMMNIGMYSEVLLELICMM